jgi:hypothetical protein
MPIQQLVLNDSTPTYTTFASASAVSVPASLGTMTITSPSVGATGTLTWSFTGQLMPSTSGSVQFSVVIAP